MITDRAEGERSAALVAAARAQHVATEPGPRLDDTSAPHPRGLHVPCRRCRVDRGAGCEHPTRGAVPGFVHPSRLADERAWIAALSQSPESV